MGNGRWETGRPANARAARLAHALRSAERWLTPIDLGDVLEDAMQLLESPWASGTDAAPPRPAIDASRRAAIVKLRGTVRPAMSDPERAAETVARLIAVALEFVGDAAARPITARTRDQEEGPALEIVAQRSDDRGPAPSPVAELDLFLARHLAALHGGRLEVRARGGVLTLVLTLPAMNASSDFPTPIPRRYV